MALTYGQSKPSDLEFMTETVTELEDLLQNGFDHNGTVHEVRLCCVVCDASAKAMVKACKLYSGYYGCDRCNQKGVWVGRGTYLDADVLQLWTDDTFRRREQP